MNAYIKKEWMEWTRTGRGLILLIIFIFFGIFNPAMAKLTPWLYEMLEDSIGQSGLQVISVEVDKIKHTRFIREIYTLNGWPM